MSKTINARIKKLEMEYERKIQEVCDDHFEFLQDLVKLLDIDTEMPANLDDWKKIIKDKIKLLTNKGG